MQRASLPGAGGRPGADQGVTVDVQVILAALKQEGAPGKGHSMEEIAFAMGCSLSKARDDMRKLVRMGRARVVPRNQWRFEPDLAGRMQPRPTYEFLEGKEQ